MLLNCGVGDDSWEFLGQSRRSNQSILKEISPEYSLEGLMLKLQYLATWFKELTRLKRPWLGKIEDRRRRGWQRMRCLDGITDSMDMSLSKLSSVQFSHSVMSDSFQPHELQHTRPPCPSPSTGTCSNSCPLRQQCHPTISSSVAPFPYCLQFFPASGSFPMNPLFTSGGQILELQHQFFQGIVRFYFP